MSIEEINSKYIDDEIKSLLKYDERTLDKASSNTNHVVFDVVYLTITFDDYVFYPNSLLSGVVKIKNFTIKVLSKMVIRIRGISECEWTVRKNNTLRSFTGRQKFLQHEINVFGHRVDTSSDSVSYSRISNKSSNLTFLPPGESQFPFSYFLPDLIPGSWKGKYGKIHYFVSVLLEYANKYKRLYEKSFIVGPYRNLKLEPHLLNESFLEVTKRYRNVFLSLGKVTVSMWIPISGIVPGQGIPILCKIHNVSKVGILRIVFYLTMIEIYESQKPLIDYKTVRTDVCQSSHVADAYQGNYVYFCVLMTPKNLPISNFMANCSACHVKYELWLSIQPSLPRYWSYGYPNIDTNGIPIILGTVPITQWNEKHIARSVVSTIKVNEEKVNITNIPNPSDISLLLKINETDVP